MLRWARMAASSPATRGGGAFRFCNMTETADDMMDAGIFEPQWSECHVILNPNLSHLWSRRAEKF